jgi:hypothetical protein
MIKNPQMFEEFEKNLLKKEQPDFFRNLKLFEAMYEEARELNIFPLKDPMEGLEEKIRFVKMINVSKNT